MVMHTADDAGAGASGATRRTRATHPTAQR
jgi:hypothetical protein